MNLDFKEFYVDLNKVAHGRKNGVSGILRVKNDSEFIEVCIESCIDALDELIIVYNDCSDNSPEIILKMKNRYPYKIKVFNYLPNIKSHDLSAEDFNEIRNVENNSIHLLSNYYNYALSKSTCKYVMKIDADQIYFTSELQEICNLYRSNKYSIPTFKELFSFFKVYCHFKGYKSNCTSTNYLNYKSCVKKLIQLFKSPISLSGINLVHDENKWLVPLGLITDELNILPPYNGVGDHLIFKVSPQTYFIPYNCSSYNILTSNRYTYIERLVGVRGVLPFGFIWCHMNGIRRNIYMKQLGNIQKYSDSFLSIEEFVNSRFYELTDKIPTELLSTSVRFFFEVFHDAISSSGFIKTINNLQYRYPDGLFQNHK